MKKQARIGQGDHQRLFLAVYIYAANRCFLWEKVWEFLQVPH